MDLKKAKKQQTEESPFFLVIMVLFILVGFWLLATSRPESSKTGQAELSSQRPGAQGVPLEKAVQGIDENMKDTLIRQKLGRQKMEIQNSKFAPGVGPLTPENLVGDPSEEYGVEMSRKDHGRQVIEDLSQDDFYGPGYYKSPEEEVLSDYAQKQWIDEYDKAFNKEYAKEFVENARKDGVEIQLNDKLEIIGIRRVRKPNEPIRIPQSNDFGSDVSR